MVFSLLIIAERNGSLACLDFLFGSGGTGLDRTLLEEAVEVEKLLLGRKSAAPRTPGLLLVASDSRWPAAVAACEI